MTLVIEDLGKTFDDVKAVKSLSFTLPKGTCTALLGPNGAGKSTAIKMLVTLVTPDKGRFLVENENLFSQPAKIRDMLGYVSQELAMDKMLTGAEFMRFCAGILHLNWKQHGQRAMDLLNHMGLGDAADRKVGDYSGGMKRRLDLASALLNDPAVLVLDEPTTGLDLEAREMIWELLRGYLNDGGSILLASHDFREVGELADNVVIMQSGEVTLAGKPADLKQQLGAYIIRLKTQEFMDEAAFKAATDAFGSWGEVTTYDDDEYATLAYKGGDELNTLQGRIYKQMDEAGLAIHSLNIQKPDLEDVYRFRVGGEA